MIAKLGKSNKLSGITDANRMDLARVLFCIRVYFFDSLFFQKCWASLIRQKVALMGHQEQHPELFLLHIFVVYVFVKGWFLMYYSKQQCSNLLTVEHIHCRKAYDNLNLSIVLASPKETQFRFDKTVTHNAPDVRQSELLACLHTVSSEGNGSAPWAKSVHYCSALAVNIQCCKHSRSSEWMCGVTSADVIRRSLTKEVEGLTPPLEFSIELHVYTTPHKLISCLFHNVQPGVSPYKLWRAVFELHIFYLQKFAHHQVWTVLTRWKYRSFPSTRGIRNRTTRM